MDTYAMTYDVRWADLDANGHLRYSAHIDATGDLRYRHFAENGFPPRAFEPAMPTPDLLAVLRRIPRAPDFEIMRESRRRT